MNRSQQQQRNGWNQTPPPKMSFAIPEPERQQRKNAPNQKAKTPQVGRTQRQFLQFVLQVHEASVEFKFFQPIDVLVQRLLLLLLEQKVANDQVIHIRAHEAKICVFRGADNWFAAHVE